MFEDEGVIKLCIRNAISVQQYFFMWLVRKQDFNKHEAKSLAKQYVKLVKAFEEDDVHDLVRRRFIEDFNEAGKSNPELYMLTPQAEVFFTNEESGEQLLNAYPSTFPLGDGKNFLARTGAPREVLIEEYIQAIGYSRKKHELAMKQLENYKRLVKEGKMNGYRLVDWIRNRLWESVADFMKGEETTNERAAYEDI